jgi:hypothetical protein
MSKLKRKPSIKFLECIKLLEDNNILTNEFLINMCWGLKNQHMISGVEPFSNEQIVQFIKNYKMGN